MSCFVTVRGSLPLHTQQVSFPQGTVMAGWLPEGLAAALAEFRKLTEPHPWAHAAWLMPLVLLGAWLLGKFFEWVRVLLRPLSGGSPQLLREFADDMGDWKPDCNVYRLVQAGSRDNIAMLQLLFQHLWSEKGCSTDRSVRLRRLSWQCTDKGRLKRSRRRTARRQLPPAPQTAR